MPRKHIGFEDLDFSSKDPDKRLDLVDQIRELITTLPAHGLATMILRRASLYGEPSAMTIDHAKENLVGVLAAASVFDDPTDPTTPEKLKKLAERWGPEIIEYLRPELQTIAQGVLGGNGNGKKKA